MELNQITYIHPLSQIVLEHLQSKRYDWIEQMGLDTGLEINDDGTFLLRFPSTRNNNNNDNNIHDDNDNEDEDDDDSKDFGGRIWTSYDSVEKKHWLTVHRGDLVGRYLLQDNMKPAWHSDRRSTPEKVQDAVDAMISKLS